MQKYEPSDLKKYQDATPEWRAWDQWRWAFCSSRIGDMTVRQLLMGMDKLKQEPQRDTNPTDSE